MSKREPTKTPAVANDFSWVRWPMRKYLDLRNGQASPEQVIEDIRGSAELNSGNIWVLLFAILVASVGLNINSTAVIIGAMLISPLMGPIMAIGLGVSVNDFDLMRRSAINLGFAALASVLVSAAYFTLSPLQLEGNELLARTSPTAWDALIATFGGLAGAVGATRREKSNVIPGVAIATALMPPLCTAGYSLAAGNFRYLGGALYLFYVNSICIGVGTLIVCRALKYPHVAYLDAIRRRNVRRAIAIVLVVTLLPSTFFAYRLVRKTIFEKNAGAFVTREIGSPETQIISRSFSFEDNSIQVLTLGRPISDRDRKRLDTRLLDYGLEETKLVIRSSLDIDAPYSTTRGPSEEERRSREEANLKQLLGEMKALYPFVRGVAAGSAPLVTEKQPTERLTLVYVNSTSPVSFHDRRRLVDWLEARTGGKVRMILE